MKIGFDLDGIFIDTPPFIPRKLLERFYKTKRHGKMIYRIPSYPEQLLRKATHLPFLRPPIKENIAFLKSFPKKNNKLFLISSRYNFLEGETKRFLKTYDMNQMFEGIYLNLENKQANRFKSDIIKKLELDMHIDDDLFLINFVAKENPKTKFFWFNNSDEKTLLANNVTKIAKLEEILK